MVVHHYSLLSSFPSQDELAALMRTTSDSGTLSDDIVRGLRRYNLGAFLYRNDSCWLDGLASIVNDDKIPVVVLQRFSDTDHGGHFRVVVDVNAIDQTVTMLDPWDREGNPHLLVVNYSTMCNLWNYHENNGPSIQYPAHFGAFSSPLRLSGYSMASDKNASMKVVVSAEYWCPDILGSFCSTQKSSSLTSVILSFVDHTTARTWDYTVDHDITPGNRFEYSTDITVDPALSFCSLTVFVRGTVRGSVPPYYSDSGAIVFPGYNYEESLVQSFTLGA
jgi:hypothetical protein